MQIFNTDKCTGQVTQIENPRRDSILDDTFAVSIKQESIETELLGTPSL